MNLRKESGISGLVRRYQNKAAKLRNIVVVGFARYLERAMLGLTCRVCSLK